MIAGSAFISELASSFFLRTGARMRKNVQITGAQDGLLVDGRFGGNLHSCAMSDLFFDSAFVNGAWALPDTLRDAQLPDTLERAFDSRLQALSATAHQLLRVLALRAGLVELNTAGLVALMDGEADAAQVFRGLQELTTAQLVEPRGEDHAIRMKAMGDAVLRSLRRADARRFR